MSSPERLRAVLPRFVDTLHGAARETGLTDEELMAVLTFLGEVARGERIGSTGRVTSAPSGDALPEAVVDVWHAGADGRYSNERAPGGDPWHIRGRLRTDAAGRYSIETVLPSHYTVKQDGPVGRLLTALGRHPWRPAHIHLRVTAEGHRPLVTQVYLAASPYLDDDVISGVREQLVRAPIDGRLTFDVTLED